MYHILIVDDERRERAGLEKLIRRFGYPLEVYQAENGEKALEMFEEIDILLTDIKMPFMTGIELIDAVHQKGYTPFCIIFSAYGEFEYAQNAISLGVIQYLLKPILLEDFQKLFDRVCELCEEKYRRIEENKHIQEEKKNQKIAESFRNFLRYLENESYPAEGKGELERLFSRSRYRIFLISSYSFLFSLHWKDFKSDIKKIMGEDTVIINMEDSQILLLAPEDSERKEKELRRCCERMIEIFQNTYQIEVFVVAGIICTGLDEIREEYKKILEIIDYQFFASESSYILRDNECRNKKQSDMLPMYFNKIDTCIKLKDYKGIRDEFDKVFDYIDRNVGFSSIYIKYNFTYIMKKMCEGLNIEEHLVDVVEKIYHARSLESVRQVVVQFITQVEQDHEAFSPDNRLVSMAKKLVGEKYQEVSLGVSYIADELNVSLPYLSTLFKMETGRTLVKYITSYRIEQAKYLLRMSNMKVVDVAEKVGYLNTSYFISLFRNREGCSPQQYREKEFNHENKEA